MLALGHWRTIVSAGTIKIVGGIVVAWLITRRIRARHPKGSP
jgi:hypothetical protein